jgi:hypothetical protein
MIELLVLKGTQCGGDSPGVVDGPLKGGTGSSGGLFEGCTGRPGSVFEGRPGGLIEGPDGVFEERPGGLFEERLGSDEGGNASEDRTDGTDRLSSEFPGGTDGPFEESPGGVSRPFESECVTGRSGAGQYPSGSHSRNQPSTPSSSIVEFPKMDL